MDLTPLITVTSSTPLTFQQAAKMVKKFHVANVASSDLTGTGVPSVSSVRLTDDCVEKLTVILEEFNKACVNTDDAEDSVIERTDKKKNKKRRRESIEAEEKEKKHEDKLKVKQEIKIESTTNNTPSQKKKKHKKHDSK